MIRNQIPGHGLTLACSSGQLCNHPMLTNSLRCGIHVDTCALWYGVNLWELVGGECSGGGFEALPAMRFALLGIKGYDCCRMSMCVSLELFLKMHPLLNSLLFVLAKGQNQARRETYYTVACKLLHFIVVMLLLWWWCVCVFVDKRMLFDGPIFTFCLRVCAGHCGHAPRTGLPADCSRVPCQICGNSESVIS